MRSHDLEWFDVTLASPADNLRFDDELLMRGQPALRASECTAECVVMGLSGRPDRDVYLDECDRAGIPVLRRSSGGGTVLLGPGCLVFSLVLPLQQFPRCRDVRHSMQWIVDRIRSALDVADLRFEGQSDLAWKGRKVSGNAQRRTRDAILHHGTLLYGFDARRAEMLLKHPAREPAYRAGRSHGDFLGNLPLSAAEIRQRLREAWCSQPI